MKNLIRSIVWVVLIWCMTIGVQQNAAQAIWMLGSEREQIRVAIESRVETISDEKLTVASTKVAILLEEYSSVTFKYYWVLELVKDVIDTKLWIDAKSYVQDWDLITMDYVWMFDDWTLFDTNIQSVAVDQWVYNQERLYEPLEFVVWSWAMIPGIETGVVWMRLGENKRITVEPDDAYGQYSSEFVQNIPIDQFDEAGFIPEVWEVYNFVFGSWTVLSISSDQVLMDFNHPLTWERLVFDVTITSLTKASN